MKGYLKFYNRIIFFCIFLFSLLSCTDSHTQIKELFNEQSYGELRSLLKKMPRTWESYLYKNKLNIEEKKPLQYTIEDIFSLYLKDSSPGKKRLEKLYYGFRILPRSYVMQLLDLADKLLILEKPKFYYPELFLFFESKNKKYFLYSVDKIMGQFNQRYSFYVLNSVKNMLNKQSVSDSKKSLLKKIASHFERYDEESSYYNSSFINYPYKVQIKKNKIIQIYQDRVNEKKISDITATDFFLLEEKELLSVVDSIINKKKVAYSFILSKRKLNLEGTKPIKELILSNLPGTYKNYLIHSVHLIAQDSVSNLLENDSIPSYIKVGLFDLIEQKTYSTSLLNLYFRLFRRKKLQNEIEKRILMMTSDSLGWFLEGELSSTDNRNIAYAMYFIGKKRMRHLKKKIVPFLSHENKNLQFEAEETLKRLY